MFGIFILGFLSGILVCIGFAWLLAKGAGEVIGSVIERLWGR
jgi:hypothetical protein